MMIDYLYTMINRLSNVTSLILMRRSPLLLGNSQSFVVQILCVYDSLFAHHHHLSLSFSLSPLILCPVFLILLLQQLSILFLIRPQPRRVRIQRRIVIRLPQQTLNGQQNRPHIIRRRPLLFQNIQANVPELIDVRMETRGGKFHHRRFERVLVRER